MTGRPKKQHGVIYRPIFLEWGDNSSRETLDLIVLCPECGSSQIGNYGTYPRKGTRVEGFQCKDLRCPSRLRNKYPKQFTLQQSFSFRKSLERMLSTILTNVLQGRISQQALAEQYHCSPSLITYLRQKVEKILHRLYSLDRVVDVPTTDRAISLDETF